jgi:hypothetical protein
VAQIQNVLFSYDGVRFLAPAALSVNMRVEEVQRLVLTSPDGPFGGVAPVHLDVTMLDYDVDLLALTGGQVAGRRAAHLYFYPTSDSGIEDFARAYPPVGDAAARMRALLQAPFLDIPKSVPVLPWTDARPVFQARCHRLFFQSGQGFAFLTRYGGNPADEPGQEDLEYVFQGLTDDGLVYVSAWFPVRAPQPLGSPLSPGGDEADAAQAPADAGSDDTPPLPLENLGLGETPQPTVASPDSAETTRSAVASPDSAETTRSAVVAAPLTEAEIHRREEVVNFEVLSPADFTPNLEALDSVFRSIAVDIAAP